MRPIARLALTALLLGGASIAAVAERTVIPNKVTLPGAAHTRTRAGYVCRPPQAGAERLPAVVMMHARAGAYSQHANGTYDDTTLSKRHKFWGETLAQEG